MTISNHCRLVVDTVGVDRENCHFVARGQFAQLVHNRGAHFFTLEKAAGAIVAQIKNQDQRERLARLAFTIEIRDRARLPIVE